MATTSERRVAIADGDAAVRYILRHQVEGMGHHVVVDAADGQEFVEGCDLTKPDLVIADLHLKTGDGGEAVGQFACDRRLPLVVVADHCDAASLNRLARLPAFAYLLKPLRAAEVEPAIAITLMRYGEILAIREEAEASRQALADRKLIERAKGLLMKRGRIDEPEAFERLRKSARQHSTKIVEIARSILMSEGLLLDGDCLPLS